MVFGAKVGDENASHHQHSAEKISAWLFVVVCVDFIANKMAGATVSPAEQLRFHALLTP